MYARPIRKVPDPLVVRGVLYTLRRRCGRASCRCAAGELHETPALAYPEDGRTKTLTLSAGDVAEVRAALKRYNGAKSALDRDADRGVAALRARRAAERTTRKS
ncbi:MAG TPA: DUF6788 family protein [Acidimicrobiales bacterium]|nr:DUF6788 family protein [Acidimicrobiales bacterium]